VGLVDLPRWQRFEHKLGEIERLKTLLQQERAGDGSFLKLLRRPEVSWPQLVELIPDLASVPVEVARQIEYDAKYEGYIARQDQEVERNRRLAERRIPDSFDYARLTQLRTEAREKLLRIRPVSIAQASRISGITPADVALLMIHLDAR
jgi:tRNA uridine 5-carboxymethylaminomethyl modification enzyme